MTNRGGGAQFKCLGLIQGMGKAEEWQACGGRWSQELTGLPHTGHCASGFAGTYPSSPMGWPYPEVIFSCLVTWLDTVACLLQSSFRIAL